MIIVPAEVSSDQVDAWADDLQVGQALMLRVETLPRAGLLAEARVVGLFAEARAMGRTVTLELAETLPLEAFLETPLGAILTLMSDAIQSTGGVDVRQRAREHLLRNMRRDNGIVGSASEVCFPVLDNTTDQPSFPHYPALDDQWFVEPRKDTARSFRANIEHRLDSLLGLSRDHARPVSQFVLEAWSNTVEHARDDLAGRPIRGLRCLLIARRKTRFSIGGEVESRYLEAVRARLGSVINGFLEVTVCDSGIGIGPRLSRDPNFRELPDRQQFAWIEKAVRRGVSSKNRQGSGLGYDNIFLSLFKLQALFLLKSGEVSAGKTYLPPFEPHPSPQLIAALRPRLRPTRGTSISLLVPSHFEDC
ncbi:MAG: hypothetical protein AB7I25_07085 [Vicinamibacterales bacterium]